MRQMTGSDIVVKLRSDSLDLALQVANQIEEVMDSLPDIGEASIDTTEGLPEVEIVIDRQRAYALGVDVTTVAKEINYAINGVTATTYRENGKEYSVKVMYQPSDMQKMMDLERIFVNGTGGKVNVSNFASIKKGLGPTSIKRENQTRVVKVSADVLNEKDVRTVVEQLQEAVGNAFVTPEGVSIIYEGSWKDNNDQWKTYFKIIVMAILLVFGVMAGTYENFKAPLINLCTIPFMIIGVVAIYLITGQAVSSVSAIGLIMLVGIVVNNGIILVDYTSLLVDRGRALLDACLEAGCSRLRPVLMTTLTTVLGMLPMCFTSSSGSASMVQPIGVAVVGGLTSSTFVTLFFIPVLYSLVMKPKNVKKSRIQVALTEARAKAGANAAALQAQSATTDAAGSAVTSLATATAPSDTTPAQTQPATTDAAGSATMSPATTDVAANATAAPATATAHPDATPAQTAAASGKDGE